MIPTILSALALLMQVAATEPMPEPRATLRLFNPTEWSGPTTVEVPVGRIAAPHVIDWGQTRLISNGCVVPFALREGCAHWKASLEAPGTQPRSEDLLVFSCEVPPGQWVQVDVVPGTPDATSAVKRDQGRIIIDYPAGRAVIDEPSGSLLSWEAGGASLLSAPFLVTPYQLAEDGYQLEGPFGCGYTTASVGLRKTSSVAQRARCVSLSSNAALTEVSFVLEPDLGPALGLTYRLHASGELEIVVDERPWRGPSPWLHHAVEYTLPLAGTLQRFPYLENRWAFYGFRDYTASVKSTACAYEGAWGAVLELGGESVNGRQFARRLMPVAPDRQPHLAALVELADEGLVVDVLPARMAGIECPVRIVDDAQAAAVTDELTQALTHAGVELAPDGIATGLTIRLALVPEAAGLGISGDGYVAAGDEAGYTLQAGTRLGLYSAVRGVAAHLQRYGSAGGLPLIARNPVVELRGGGFGGGNFEVDFPYGDDEQWCRVFDGLLDSGMNVFACMGMWANWKMPVSYQYMPELRSEDPDAYDESSGARFAELEYHRAHGLKLAGYLQDRGGQVWLWIPIGCVPTTYARKFPEAMAPGSDKIPCFTHPEYRRYIGAFFRELLETYPLDGLFLVRDDNGGICTCERCQEFVAQSRTKNPVWEQYLVIYDWLRTHRFTGAVAVYPYFDNYEPQLDPLLPDDLYIVGHGSGVATLARHYEFVGPMGDTWLDNLYANFRVPPAPRMKRLLADRGSFWIGGAYVGCELPWESIGFFGWEPTATPNSLRYQWSGREFGQAAAGPFLAMSDPYEAMWDIMALHMPPADWMALTPAARTAVVQEGMDQVGRFRAGLAELQTVIDPDQHQRWLGHVGLYPRFFEYHLHRLDLFAKVYDQVRAHRDTLDRPEGLPPGVRQTVLAWYDEMYDWAARYDAAMQQAPDGMLTHCRWMTKPYKEWMAGYDQWLDGKLEIKQFAGTLRVETDALRPGEPFTLRVMLHNQGVCPWIAGAGQRIEVTGDVEQLGLPAEWQYVGEPLAPGDRRTVELHGTVPQDPGAAQVTVALISPYRVPEQVASATAVLAWP
ncbi:MAG: hypothetical protein GXY58_07325 [Planctomycetaceae bacterium]|nr:hypothetical protein [Planctomycetaceae bacterium]